MAILIELIARDTAEGHRLIKYSRSPVLCHARCIALNKKNKPVAVYFVSGGGYGLKGRLNKEDRLIAAYYCRQDPSPLACYYRDDK